jgi:hypothetical protein
MTTTNKTATRFRVYDLSDRFVGVWYARDEIAAIRAAVAAGYDAWSASCTYSGL